MEHPSAKEVPQFERGRIPVSWLAAALILLAGIGVRFWGVDQHFSHLDDVGVGQLIQEWKTRGISDLLIIPKNWTYAPLQFLITHFLITPAQTYREILFWGRLPSAFFGSAGLAGMLLFYAFYEGKDLRKGLLALAVLAFSWENIIHARQMHNYALGTACVVMMLVLWIRTVQKPEITLSHCLMDAVFLAVLIHGHYQVLFFMPGYYGSLFFFGWQRGDLKFRLGRNLAAGASLFFLLILPILMTFLWARLKVAGLNNGNEGPHKEFVLFFPAGLSFMGSILHALRFYTVNFSIMFQAMTGFLPLSHPLNVPLGYYLYLTLFMFGSWRLATTKNPERKALGIFFGGVGLVWIFLIYVHKLTLSPTRHNLLLLPLLAITIAEGLEFFLEKSDRTKLSTAIRKTVYWMLPVAISLLFLTGFGKFLKERQDPFSENHIFEILEKYDVDAVWTLEWTLPPGLMKSLQERYGYEGEGYVMDDVLVRADSGYRTVAWLSHRSQWDTANARILPALNKTLAVRNYFRARGGKPPLPFIPGPLAGYHVIYEEVRPSPVEIEYAGKTKDGPNSFYFSILRKD